MAGAYVMELEAAERYADFAEQSTFLLFLNLPDESPANLLAATGRKT